MRDDIDTGTGEAFLAAFKDRAEAEFSRRMARVTHYLSAIMAHEQGREVFSALVAMDPDLRRITIGRTVDGTDGAQSLAGTEDLVRFVTGFVVEAHECHVVPYEPPAHLRQAHLRSAIGAARGDHAKADERHRLWLAEQARFAEFRFGQAPDGSVLGAAAILRLVTQNERTEAEFEGRRADMDRRRRSVLADLDKARPDGENAAPAPR